VQSHTLCFPHVAPAIECDISTLLVALQIAVESDYVQVSFESDSQFVVNAIANGDAYVNELARGYFD
jgi:ribonuclease HI